MKALGQLLTALTWLLVAGSLVIITGGLFGRPLLLAAVPTGSMVPALSPGDLIAVMPTWAMPAPGPGSIIVFKTERDQDWVVHRIIGGNATTGFITKGDNNEVQDPEPVRPQDIAGIVPEWDRGAVRLPRLGLLSTAKGPLSSPVVAGVALVMGVYLLALDLRPSLAERSGGLRRRSRARSSAVLTMYLGLSATAFLTTLIPAWTMSSRTPVEYDVLETMPVTASQARGRYVQGRPHTEEIRLPNPSPLPLVVVFQSAEPELTYAPGWAIIPPAGEFVFEARLANQRAGHHDSYVNMGVFLPLLPASWLAALATRSLALAAFVSALVPALVILGIAAMDQRNRAVLSRLHMRLMA